VNKAELERTALSEQAYKSLRTAILTGRIPFGTQLIVKDLAVFIGFSATPIKQALTSLEREGLVILIPYRGFFVPNFDNQDVREIYEVREALERRAARTAARHMTDEQLKSLESILVAQVKSAREGNTETHVDLDLHFHRAIAEFSRNQRLVDQAHSILGQAQLIIASSILSTKRFSAIHKEHQDIIDALRSKDADKVELMVWQHLLNAQDALYTHYAAETPQSSPEHHADRLLLTTERLELKAQLNNQEKIASEKNIRPAITLEKVLSDKEKNLLRDALAEYIGPMAIFASSEVLRKTTQITDAIATLAARIPNKEDARAFSEAMNKRFQVA